LLSLAFAVFWGSLAVSVPAQGGGTSTRFVRGDSNTDGRFDLADPVSLLGHLFLDGVTPSCSDAADSNDDGRLDLSDAAYSLAYLFLGGPRPPSPFARCDIDRTQDALDCAEYSACPEVTNEIAALRTRDEGIEIELFSSEAFPVRALIPMLCIGGFETVQHHHPDGDLNTIIFLVARDEFEALEDGELVTVQYGFCNPTLQGAPYWDLWIFEELDKGRLDE
jgi:hypothetical protein